VRRGGCGIKKISAKPTLSAADGVVAHKSHFRYQRPPPPLMRNVAKKRGITTKTQRHKGLGA